MAIKMGKFKSLWNAIFSSEPVKIGYQPVSKELTHYRAWCVEVGRHFHAHAPNDGKHVMGECPLCGKNYLVPARLKKMITEEHHLELTDEVMKPPRKP